MTIVEVRGGSRVDVRGGEIAERCPRRHTASLFDLCRGNDLQWRILELGWVGLGWVGLRWVWVGLGWVGLDWVGLGWVGLGWVGLGWFGLGWIGGGTNPEGLESGSFDN